MPRAIRNRWHSLSLLGGVTLAGASVFAQNGSQPARLPDLPPPSSGPTAPVDLLPPRPIGIATAEASPIQQTTYRSEEPARLPSLVSVENRAAEPAPAPRAMPDGTPPSVPLAAAPSGDAPLPINLPTALHLAQARPIDVQVAAQRVQAAAAQLQRANVLWLPTLFLGGDYARHDGHLQDIRGDVFGTSKSSVMVGGGPSAVFAVTDAIFSPLANRQLVRSRDADQQTALNDSMLSVAEAYFTVQQARGELAGAQDAERRSVEVVRRAEQLVPGLSPPAEAHRARADLARRRQVVESARERWETASAELTRLLRLPPAAVVEPIEQPNLRVELIDLARPVDELIPVGLTNRPELASHQALVQATLARLKQERMRPLVPSVLIRGNATNPGGTLSSGLFGGGLNSDLRNFDARNSVDMQLVWELQNLGLGNRAAIRERTAENRTALWQLMGMQDRVAAEIVAAHAQARRAAARARQAEVGLREAIETADKNLAGMSQIRRAGELLVLVFRPQEVVAAVQALDQAYRDYYGAVADANRAQFRLYRALGQLAQSVLHDLPPGEDLSAPLEPTTPLATIK